MLINKLLVKQYAVCVYQYGIRAFSAIMVDYHEPAKKYAGENYTLEIIDKALVNGYITEKEYSDTIAYVTSVAVE
ncbi:hypothetical protein [Clostridium sp. FP1]|uniref:hypothetical protein n=1 Tax=Clostridium sp. FP1 TaxID=2724076 RepID=UPI0013E9672B|nr:hypothetical protein [Clostridium sp. FP1]MBZ9637516.1 hypothetical protein [Clostridium sp. FP1]